MLKRLMFCAAWLIFSTQSDAVLKINEVFYNVGELLQGGNQYVELFNTGPTNEYLDGKILTDEAGTGLEGVFRFPGAPGGTNFIVLPLAYVVIAVDASGATTNADWECYAGGLDSDNPSVPNLTLVDGVFDLSLSPGGDNVILATGADTNIPIDSATVIDGMNYGGGGGELAPLSATSLTDANPDITTPVNISLGRCSDGNDSDVSTTADFFARPRSPKGQNNCERGIFITDAAVVEGNAGTTAAVFTVTITSTSAAPVTVNFATSNGTALAGSDYAATNGLLTFPPGNTSQTVSVSVFGDTLFELDETFSVELTNPSTNAVVVDAQGVGTIVNDDAAPNVSIQNASVTEGNEGTTNAIFIVTLSFTSTVPASVNYSTANGSAQAGSDYQAISSATLLFPPGVVTQAITVTVLGDVAFELDETFFVNLSNPTNATITNASAVGTIINDDPPALVSIQDVSVTEGNAGTTSAVFVVTLSDTSSVPISVNYSTSNGTALAGSDYVGVTNALLIFNPGVTSQTISITVNGDTVFELDEIFYVNLFNPTNTAFDDNQGIATIINDDPAPSIAIQNATVTEGNTGTTNAVFIVTRSFTSPIPSSVNFATSNGTADAGTDYTATNGLLIFASGIGTQFITVAVLGDTAFEPNETFFVMLSNPTNATLGTTQATGTILNDDLTPTTNPPVFTAIAGRANAITSTWAAVSGAVYQLQFATNVFAQAWTNVGNVITAQASSASGVDTNAAAATNRIYRVLLIY